MGVAKRLVEARQLGRPRMAALAGASARQLGADLAPPRPAPALSDAGPWDFARTFPRPVDFPDAAPAPVAADLVDRLELARRARRSADACAAGAAVHRELGRLDPWPIPGTKQVHPGARRLEGEALRLGARYHAALEEVAERYGRAAAQAFDRAARGGETDGARCSYGQRPDRVQGDADRPVADQGASTPLDRCGCDGASRPAVRMRGDDRPGEPPGPGHPGAGRGFADAAPEGGPPGLVPLSGLDRQPRVRGPLPVMSFGRFHRVHDGCGGTGCAECSGTGYASMGPVALISLGLGPPADPTPRPAPAPAPAGPAAQRTFDW